MGNVRSPAQYDFLGAIQTALRTDTNFKSVLIDSMF